MFFKAGISGEAVNSNKVKKKAKKIKKKLAKFETVVYNVKVLENSRLNGLSPKGKALDSDSSISRFESLWAS